MNRFSNRFLYKQRKINKRYKERINIELLGYQLVKINKDTYNASALLHNEEIGDILNACIENNLDIIYLQDGKLILKEI